MNKIGLCLTGGGSRGAYQVGAAKALEELGILSKVSVFSGTSIGAVNCSLLSTKTPSEVKNLWLSVSPDQLKSTQNLFKRLVKERLEFAAKGAYEIKPLEELLKQNLDLKKLKKQSVFVTLSEGGQVNEGIFGLLKSSYSHYIKKDTHVIYSPLHEQSEKNIIKQILASCSIPIIFPPLKVGEKQYFDGGLYDNVPVRPLIDSDCDTVIIIHLNRIYFLDKSKYPGIHFIEIKHGKGLGGILNFDPLQSEITFNSGYQDTLAYFEKNPFNL
ncbi:MAG: patatin-like phospholipase family protein [Firmicutes bacterium]|nr:patatin-like phospholipase family protein [Bacillota bacterium]